MSSSSLEDLGAGGVDVGDRLGGDDHPPSGFARAANRPHQALGEQLGVGKEDRRVEAVQHQTRNLARLRVTVDVVVTLGAVDPTEDRVVRAPSAPYEVAERERDRDEDALERTEDGDSEQRDE